MDGVVTLRQTQPHELHISWVDYSTLTALNTCPTWGLIHSIHGKRFTSSSRAMPLEAGRAMHDVFAAVRMFDLMTHLRTTTGSIPDDVYSYGMKLFKAKSGFEDRWPEAIQIFDTTEDDKTRCIQFALHLLATAGFYDDPDDTRRTQTNLETAAIAYIDRYPLGRYIPVYHDAAVRIGVEVPFDLIVQVGDKVVCRFVGRVDGICADHQTSAKTVAVHENKTGSRIDTVWSSSFDTSHQVTGYCIAASELLSRSISDCMMWGLQVPIPKSSFYSDGMTRYPVQRTPEQFARWAKWVLHTLRIVDEYGADPTNAPMYTHSCNRYFRACSLIPLCTETPDMRKHIFEKEMITDRWSPLNDEEPADA
jgi:hypothetical protein